MTRILVAEFADLKEIKGRYPELSIHLDEALFAEPERLIQEAREYDVLVVRNESRLDSDFFKAVQGSQLKLIGRLGAGLEKIDIDAAKDAQIPISYTMDANTDSCAQLTLAQILMSTRFIPQAMSSIKDQGQWDRKAHTGREISELTIGIVGYGRVGQKLHNYLMPMYPNKVLVHDILAIEETPPGSEYVTSIETVFEHCDVVSLHVPLTPQTTNMVNSDLLALAKNHLVLINDARGGVVREPDLYRFLVQNPKAQAVLDVRQQEPTPFDSLSSLPNVFPTPHIAALTAAAQGRVEHTLFADIKKFHDGEKLENLVFQLD